MTTINIRNNFPAVAAELNRLGQDVGNKAVVRAINKTIDQGKTQMARQISQEFRVSVGTIRQQLKVYKASARSGSSRFVATLGAIKGKGRSINLIAFIARGKVSKASTKRTGRTDLTGQLQLQIKRGGGRKAIKGAFVGNQGRTVFIRTGKDRTPIKALNTIGVRQMFTTKRVNSVVKQIMLDKFPAHFERELSSILRGFAK